MCLVAVGARPGRRRRRAHSAQATRLIREQVMHLERMDAEVGPWSCARPSAAEAAAAADPPRCRRAAPLPRAHATRGGGNLSHAHDGLLSVQALVCRAAVAKEGSGTSGHPVQYRWCSAASQCGIAVRVAHLAPLIREACEMVHMGPQQLCLCSQGKVQCEGGAGAPSRVAGRAGRGAGEGTQAPPAALPPAPPAPACAACDARHWGGAWGVAPAACKALAPLPI